MPAEVKSGLPAGDGAKPSLSIVLLCLNDAGSVGSCVEEALRSCRAVVKELQVIAVDDGSTDDSATVLQELASKHGELELLRHSRNLGYGRSLGDGIMRARHEYVLCADGDGQFDLSQIPGMLRRMGHSYDIVNGWRRRRADPWYRRALGRIFSASVGRWFVPGIADVECGFKLFRLACARQLFPARRNMAVWLEVMAKARRLNLCCLDVPVRHRPRRFGSSASFTLPNVLVLLWECFALAREAVRGRMGSRTTAIRRDMHPVTQD